MIQDELFKRVSELQQRAVQAGIVTRTEFLTPAEQYDISCAAQHYKWNNLLFFGGNAECERKIAFFLPEYILPEYFEADEYICAVKCVTKFSSPGHRDYLGSLMGLGIRREVVGDIHIDGENGYLFCLPSVLQHILLSLDKIGRSGVKTEQLSLCDVPIPEKKRREVTFTVKSPRLDAVASGMFGISRSSVSPLIDGGLVMLNYHECLKADAQIDVGDIISIRGKGKGEIAVIGSQSRKGRTFITAEVFC